MKKILLSLVGLGLSLASLQASTTLQFGSGGTLTNLQNSSGSNTSTLVWGIIVDTTGNGFQSGNYTPGFAMSGNDVVGFENGKFLSTTGGATDDLLIISQNLMATGGSTDGSSGLAKPTNLLLNYANGVLGTGNQAFAIIWFDTTLKNGQLAVAGNKYGILTSPDFRTPADTAGGNVPFGQLFVGVDPARLPTFTFVPEPSAALLGMLGALGLLRRRR